MTTYRLAQVTEAGGAPSHLLTAIGYLGRALDEDGAKKVFRLIEALEDSDDVQNVWANFDVSDEVMAAVG